MSPSRPFILRPVATSLLMVAILLAGTVAYLQLPVSALPQVDYPTIQVLTFYPGASPEVMASSVTSPLERQFGQIPGLSQMTSTSSGGGDSDGHTRELCVRGETGRSTEQYRHCRSAEEWKVEAGRGDGVRCWSRYWSSAGEESTALSRGCANGCGEGNGRFTSDSHQRSESGRPGCSGWAGEAEGRQPGDTSQQHSGFQDSPGACRWDSRRRSDGDRCGHTYVQ